MKDLGLASVVGAALLALAACGGSGEAPDVLAPVEGWTSFLRVTSPAFENGSPIPTTFTCDGDDRSPALAWEFIPSGAQELALIMEGSDGLGGTRTHWIAYDLGLESSGLPEGAAEGLLEGENDFKRIGYGGPCPPTGSDHRYFFRLYALDSFVGLGPGATKSELFEAINGHVLGVGQIMGTYAR